MNTTSHRPTVAVLGIGLMGSPMARRLCEAGLSVHGLEPHARQGRAPARLRRPGARHAPPQAVREADVVITMLEHGEVVEDVLFEQGVADAMQPGALVMDMSLHPAAPRRATTPRAWARWASPIWTRRSRAARWAPRPARWPSWPAARQRDFERALPVFAPLGRATHVGPHGAGQLAKLANQMIVGITIGAVAEALLLCQKGGADLAKVQGGHQRRLCRQPHPAGARPAHGGARLRPARRA